MNLNTQFVFEGKLKRNLIIGMALGAVCLLLSALHDDEYHTRFWTNFLHNSVFFTGIAFMAMFFMSAQITAFSGWNITVKRIWEAMSQFMGVGLVLLAVIVIGVWGHFHHLYHWNTPGITDPNNPIYDKIIAGKSGFLNAGFFTIGVLGFLGVWFFWAYNLRKLSIAQDSNETASFDYYKRQRKWAATFLPLGGFLSTVFLWQTVMSIDPHWYSTMFAWYSMVSLWLASMSLTIMLIIFLKSRGHLEYITHDHLHDIGKYLFGISVFWMYLWFDQFMLIWYANNGEETIYFKERMNHYPVLFWGNLLMNFVTPFLILMRNDTKRKFGTMFFVAAIVFFGHWWDYFYMIKPGARIAAHEAKEIQMGTFGKKAEHKDLNTLPETEAAVTTTQSEQPGSENLREPNVPNAVETPGTEAHANAVQSSQEAAAHQGEIHPEPAKDSMSQEITSGVDAGHGSPQSTAETAEASTEGAHGEGEHGEAMHDESKAFKLGYSLPGLEELGIMIGFLSLFLFFFFRQFASVSTIPLKDPYLEESLHHETGAYIEGEKEVAGDGHGHHHH